MASSTSRKLSREPIVEPNGIRDDFLWDVEEAMATRGVVVSYEWIRRGVKSSGGRDSRLEETTA